MKKYSVRIPLLAEVYVEVIAESEKEAIEKAINDSDLLIDGQSDKGYSIEEWELLDKVAYGNVYCGSIREADAEERC